jgi:phenylacetate-CoA ligase
LDRDALARRMMHALQQATGLAMRVQVLEIGSVERSEGKAVRVVDRRPR